MAEAAPAEASAAISPTGTSYVLVLIWLVPPSTDPSPAAINVPGLGSPSRTQLVHGTPGLLLTPNIADIKKEPNPLDGFDFSMISDTASKRPLESAETTIETPEAKRLKSENAPPEDGYDDEMSLLVQNALSNINDIIGQFSEEPDGQAVPTTEPGTADGAPAQEVQPAPIGFLTDPRKFVRDSNINALGSIVCSTRPGGKDVADLRLVHINAPNTLPPTIR